MVVRWLLIWLVVFSGYWKSHDSEAGITVLNNKNRFLKYKRCGLSMQPPLC